MDSHQSVSGFPKARRPKVQAWAPDEIAKVIKEGRTVYVLFPQANSEGKPLQGSTLRQKYGQKLIDFCINTVGTPSQPVAAGGLAGERSIDWPNGGALALVTQTPEERQKPRIIDSELVELIPPSDWE